ncbi:hypothetical protein J1614_006424 [Plenodomus biglobosus]|nr:hypothetical protein J1614_006424 [Plenodomus biglobosus]
MRSAIIFFLALAMVNAVTAKKGGGGASDPNCGAPFCGRKRADQLLAHASKTPTLSTVKTEGVELGAVEEQESGT